MALLLVGDQASAEDVVQDAFLGLFRGLDRLNDPSRAVAYLRVSVLNGCRSVLRGRRRARLRRAATDDLPVWSAEAAALAGEDRREVLQAVSQLPRRQREVLVLRYFLGLSDSEIAVDLGVSRGTVVSTASRALAALARKVGEASVKGRENMPAQVMEERIRDAFHAAAVTVTARDLLGLATPRARIPVAAAACVALIVAATLVVPRVVAGSPSGGTATGLAGAPRFFAGLMGKAPGNTLNIYRSATGRVVASVQAPRPDREFEAVARLGGDRTYVAAAVTGSRACTTQLYRFTIGPGGRPSGLAPLSVPQITGVVEELVGSADGNVLAYKVAGLCAPHQLTGVIHLATRQITTWSYGAGGLQPPSDGDLSLSADGSMLGFLAGSSYNAYGLTNV